MSKTSNIFSYNDGGLILPKNAIRISPSNLHRFFSDTSNWYKETLMGEAPAFKGSTSSHLGTIVHGCADLYSSGIPINTKEVEQYIESLEADSDIDTSTISRQWKPMVECLVNNYLSTHIPSRHEEFIYHEILPGIFPSGTFDAYSNGTVVDYKTTSALTAPTKISYAYRLQLLTYAWLLQQQKIPVNRIQIVYITRSQTGRVSETTGKPLKDYPSTVTILSESISETDFDFIESILTLVAHSVQRWNSTPADRYLLAQDLRLKL